MVIKESKKITNSTLLCSKSASWICFKMNMLTHKREQNPNFYYIWVTPQKWNLWQGSVTPIPFLWRRKHVFVKWSLNPQMKSEPPNLQMKDQKCKMCWCSLFCNNQASPGEHKGWFCEEEGMMTQQRASSNNSRCCRDHFNSWQTST